MTPLAGGTPPSPRRVLINWSAALVVALAVHLAVALPFFLASRPIFPDSPPPAPFLVDLAELAMPHPSSVDLAPGPEQVESAASQEQEPEEIPEQPDPDAEPEPEPEPVQEPEPEPEPELEPEPQEEKPVVEPEPEVQPEQPPEPPKPAPPVEVQQQQETPSEQMAAETTGMTTPVEEPSEQMAAPISASGQQQQMDAQLRWQNLLLAYLERRKRYPNQAQMRRQEGSPMVTFVMDRQGKILSAELVVGSGFAALDTEAVALIWRASPLPPPPEEVRGESITMTLPIHFFLARAR